MNSIVEYIICFVFAAMTVGAIIGSILVIWLILYLLRSPVVQQALGY